MGGASEGYRHLPCLIVAMAHESPTGPVDLEFCVVIAAVGVGRSLHSGVQFFV